MALWLIIIDFLQLFSEGRNNIIKQIEILPPILVMAVSQNRTGSI